MNKEDEINRGRQASEIIKNPIFKESLSKIRAIYFDAWRSSQTVDVSTREHYFALFSAIDEFEAHLISVLKTGEMASTQT